MRKILIISYYYKHKNAMASIRAIKLAKYFSRQGHQVTVLTSSQRDTWTRDYLIPQADEKIREYYAPEVRRWTWITRFLEYRRRVGQQKSAVRKIAAPSKEGDSGAGAPARGVISFRQRMVSYLKWLFYFYCSRQEDVCMYLGLKKELRRLNLPEFDTVIATYPNYGALLTGMWLKRRRKCRQLIADFRDPLYNPGFRDHRLELKYDLKCFRQILRYADRIVCVSRGIADGIYEVEPGYAKAVDVITNGFDPDDVSAADLPVSFEAGRLHFVYTGTLYHGKRCVNMLAEVLAELIREGTITKERFSFEYAGPDFSELLLQLRAFDLESTARDHGFVSRAESIAMQKAGDALLLLTWNESAYQGVVPGKLFEYMAIGNVPIIALITGDVRDSEVAVILRTAQAGCACEEAAKEADMPRLKDFVIDLFHGKVKMSSRVNQYCYESISEQYSKIME